MSIDNWFPQKPAIYDIKKTYLENAQKGPFFSEKIPERVFPPKEKWIDFLGFKIASPIGIPAGPLLTSNWIKLAAELGYDVVTYKTIRSREHPSHPLPNMIFVDTKGQVSTQKEVIETEITPSNMEDLAVTNSFGMPSMSSQFLMEDIPRANRCLKPGQIMIVSVVGTPRPNENFQEDFVQAALLAKDTGAKIVEANFSCPNVEKKEGCLYMSSDTVSELTKALVKALSPVPLILKMGVFPNLQQMREVFVAAAKSGAAGICGINSVSMHVINKQREPALGPKRTSSGICGGPIREEALRFIQEAVKINQKEKLGLTIMGCGGITTEDHFDQFLSAGAEVAMTATGMMWDPFLALRYHRTHS
jgi:dihydroorotate dehydrogenase (NAD+) catalytic subunit